MLVRANEKSATNAGGAVPFLESDALRLPFANESFDLLTAAFGFRNLANYEAGLREMQRVLKRGGTIGILEFTEPPPGSLAIFTAGISGKCCRKLAERFPVMLRPTNICRRL